MVGMPTVVAAFVALCVTLLATMTFSVFATAVKRYRARFTAEARIGLADLFLFIEPDKVFLLNVIAIVSAAAIAWLAFGTFVAALLAGLVVGVTPPFLLRYLKARRLKRLLGQLPDVLLALASAIKAGSSLLQAMEITVTEELPPIAQELDLFLREVRVGVTFDDALENLARRVPAQDIYLVVASMRISREIGGNLSDILERLADTIRRKHEMEGKIGALTSQGKMQGVVMALLPVILGVAIYQLEPVHMARLFTEPIGWAVLAGVLVLESLGFFFIRKIVNIDI